MNNCMQITTFLQFIFYKTIIKNKVKKKYTIFNIVHRLTSVMTYLRSRINWKLYIYIVIDRQQTSKRVETCPSYILYIRIYYIVRILISVNI